MSTDVSTFLAGDRTLAAKFPNIGDSVGGPITEEPRVVQQTDFKTRDPLTWSDGSPRMQAVVTVQTDRCDNENDDGRRRIFVKGQMKDAIRRALLAAGVKDLAVGGILTVTYVRDGERTDGGFGALPKVYEATYVPPDDSVNDDDAIGTGELGDTDDAPF